MKKKIILIIVLFLITGCSKEKLDINDNVEKEEIGIVTTGIESETLSVEIKSGKIILPNFLKIAVNKKTDETIKEKLDNNSLKFLNSKGELKLDDNSVSLDNKDDVITVIYVENNQEFKATFEVKAEKKFIKFGTSTLYFGKYKAEGDLPSSFNGTITIKSDGTAIYTGSKYNNGSITKANLTGTWIVKAKSIKGLQGPPDNSTAVDGVYFVWSDNTEDAYGVSNKYFGNQFMGFKWISE